MKIIKSIILAMALLTISTNVAFAQTTSTIQTTENSKTLTVKVKGVGCAMDLKSIAGNVEKLDGVSTCEVGKMGATSSFKVTFNPALVTEKEIHAAIENTAGCENPDDRPYKVKI